MSPTQCLTAHEVSSKPPKWPGEWWGALCALGQEVEAQIGFSCTHSPCTPPLFVGWLIHPLTCSLDPAPR